MLFSFASTNRNHLLLLATLNVFSVSFAVVPNTVPSTIEVSSTRTSVSAAQITSPPSVTVPWHPQLSTVFTPPCWCLKSLTMLEAQSWEIWNNEPVPVNNLTSSECYPPAFMTSYIQSIHGNTLPAFSPLICPQAWDTVFSLGAGSTCSWASTTSTTICWYIACCPR